MFWFSPLLSGVDLGQEEQERLEGFVVFWAAAWWISGQEEPGEAALA